MNEVEYILRIVLKARDELAGALKKAREELRLFANAADSNRSKIDALNTSLERLDKNAGDITDKFREWRAVMQGTADDNADVKKSFSSLTSEVETSVKTTRKAATTMKEYREQTSAAARESKELYEAVGKGSIDADRAVVRINKLGKELENLSLKFKSTSRDSERAFDWSRRAKEYASAIIAEDKRITEDAKAESEKRVKAAEEEAEKKQRTYQSALGDLRQFIDNEIKEHKRGQSVTDKIAREDERERKQRNARIAADEASAAAERLNIERREAAERDRIRQRDLAASRAIARAQAAQESVRGRRASKVGIPDIAELKAAQSELAKVTRSFDGSREGARKLNIELEKNQRVLRTIQRDAGRTTHVFGDLAKAFGRNGDSLASLDNQFRGIGMLAMVGFAQQLITVLGGLAGGFVAVAGSAAQAGAAIGGTFVAGIGQALPSIGLLTGALMRASAVMDAVKQAQTAQQASAVQAAGANKRVADATDTVRNAQEGLANANRGVRDAQEGLTQARRDAREELDDLVKAERDAELAARGAVLSQEEAQEALRQAVASGDVDAVARANLDLLEAQAAAEDAVAEAHKARVDAAKGERGGVEGTEGVVQAKRSLEDAERAAAKASRGIETAKRNAGEAAEGTQTAAATLNYLLAQLSPAERRLYQALTNIQEAYKKTYRPITDLIIDSFTRSVEGVQKIMLMPEVIKMARQTAGEIAKQLNRIFDAFTTGPMIDQFLKIADAGRKNLAPLADIAITVGKALANIAETAGPALSKLLDFIGDLADDFLKLTSHKGKMTDFFNTGEKHFEAWVKLGLAVLELFAALSGAGGAQTGFNLVNDATKAIEGLSDKVRENRDKVKEFFEDSRDIVHEVVGVLEALAIELFGAFTPERVENFATLLKQVIIPALGDAIEILGDMTEKLIEFAETPFGERLLKGLVAFVILQKVFTGILGIGKLITGVLGPIVEVFAKLAIRAAGTEASLGRILLTAGRFAAIGTGIAALVIGVVLLLDHLGLLDDAFEAIKGGFEAFWKEVGPSVDELVTSFKELWDALKEGKGAIGIIEDVLRPVLKVVIEIGGVFLRVFGRTIGRIVGGVIDVISGFVDIITGLLTGDFDKAWDGVKKTVGGFLRICTSVFRMIPELFWEFLKKLGPLAWDAAKLAWEQIKKLPGLVRGVGRSAARAFGRAWDAVVGFIKDAINDAWRWLRRLPGRLGNLADDIVDEFGSRLSNLGQGIRDGIEDIWGWLRRLPERIGNIAADAADAFVDAFTDVGGDVISGIMDGLRDLGGFARDIANAFIDLLNRLLPDRIAIPGAPDINFPDNPIRHLAAGGPVLGFGAGDKYPALLEAGEHVLTRQEVAAMGGHGAVYALRRMLGGGGQGTGGRYAEGGMPSVAAADVGRITITFVGGNLDDFASQWREFWAGLVLRARRGSNLIIGEFDEMRISTGRQMQRMYRTVEESLTDIQDRFKRRGNIIVDSWANMWNSIKRVTHDGLFYIAHETNKALTGMGEKHIDFHLSEPKKSNGKAGGGWIGTRGQRGRDMGFYPLGAGEAVLNWQHQSYVEPAMNAYYGHGLSDMFRRTRGYHAGGPEQTGFATGRLPDVKGSKPGFGVFMQLFRQLAGKDVYVMSGFRNNSTVAGTGAISNHASGNAIDISNLISQGGLPTAPPPRNALDRLHSWIGKNIPAPPRLDFLWRTTTGGNHYNHIHLGLSELVTKTIQAARNYINKNLGKEFGSLVGAIDPIKKRFVKPKGLALSKLAQKALDKVLKAANRMLEETFPDDPGTDGVSGDFELGEGSPAEKVYDFFRARGLSAAIAAGFVGTFQKESGFNTTVLNAQGSGATGLAQWLGARLTALKGKPNWQSLQTQLNFVWEELHGSESAAFAAIKRARTPEEAASIIDSQYERSDNILNAPSNARSAYNKFHDRKRPQFAKGGEVPGGGGEPVSIIAHAQEWVLNLSQQARIARMLGMSRQALKGVLGFGGRAKREFAAGGEILHIGDSLTQGMKEALSKMFKDIKIIGTKSIASDDAFDVLKKNWRKAYREVIFDIGTNDEHAGTLKKNLKRAHRLLNEDQDLVVSTVSGKNAKEKNEVIRQFAKANADSVRLVTAGSLRGPGGGIHLDPEGYRKRAGMFAEEVRAGRKEEDTAKKAGKGFEQYTTEALRKRIDDISKGVYNLPVLPIESWQKVIKETRRAFRAVRSKGRDIEQDVKSLGRISQEEGLLDKLSQARERFSERLSRNLTRATYKYNRVTGRVTERKGMDEEVEVAIRELANTRKELKKIIGEESVINKTLKKVNNRLAKLRKGGVDADEAEAVAKLVAQQADLRGRRRDIATAHAEALAAIFEAQMAKQQAYVDEINNRYEREGAGLDLFRRIATALGNEGAIAHINNVQRDMLTRQQAELQKRVDKARAAGATDLADQLEMQIGDLRVQIFESIQQELRDTADRINTRASRRLGRIDLGGRMLDAIGAVGLGSVATVAGERFTRGGMFTQRGEALQQQRTDLIALRNLAAAQKNVGLVEELNDQLAELDVTIQENTRAAFTARIEESGARFGFALNINDLNKQITDLEGTIAGQVDQAAILASLQERGNILASQRLELEGFLAEAQAAGDQQAIQDLTIALLENRIATLQNTQAIDEATGLAKDPQSFTSSAWTWFREAIFNGMGQVLPQYNMANMGASAMTGIVTGAVVYPPVTSSTNSNETNINLYESGRDPDVQEISSVVTFASKTVQ